MNKQRIVSFVAASSNSGKTTLIEKLVPILKARGMRVAVIKHAPKGFDLDKPGKDSWRFQQAGADVVALVGPGSMAVMTSLGHEPTEAELQLAAAGADIVLCEGFKSISSNKVEVFRSGISGDKPLCLGDPAIHALVSDKEFKVPIPWFELNDAEGVARFLVHL